jgi:ABC-type iron transport system FetAB ATPase subunit
MVNGKPLDTYGPADHNRILTYLSADNRLFDGTIQDNVTRFGEVTPEAAYEVARLLGIDKRLDELPGGMQTPVGDSAGGIVPPGLERQIALLRGLSHRPRMILFDHGDQGLDRDGYARLISFFGQVRGMATIVIASEDANLTSLADRAFILEDGVLRPATPSCLLPFPIARWCSDADNNAFNPALAIPAAQGLLASAGHHAEPGSPWRQDPAFFTLLAMICTRSCPMCRSRTCWARCRSTTTRTGERLLASAMNLGFTVREHRGGLARMRHGNAPPC